MKDCWKDKLKDYFFSPNASELNIDAAMSIKQQNIPQKLYRYRVLNDLSIANLKNDTVWCSNADDFNDPYDSSICFAFDKEFLNDALIEGIETQIQKDLFKYLSVDDLRKIKSVDDPSKTLIRILAAKDDTITEAMEDMICKICNDFTKNEVKEMNMKFNEVLKKGYKICSFSENIESLFMWSHYADEHKGFAIEYDFSALPVTDLRCRFLWPVIYSENLFDASKFFKEAKYNKNFNNLFGIIAAIHKAKEWQYEKEWRLVVIPFSQNDPPHDFQVPTPKSVYIGAKMTDKDKKIISEIARAKNIFLYQMELSHTEYKMVPVRIRESEKP